MLLSSFIMCLENLCFMFCLQQSLSPSFSMCEMTMDTRHKELNRWLLEAIGKVRHQKQRPSIERICAAVQQKHADVTADEVSSGLDCAIRSGAVICVENKGAISYRQSSCLPTDAGGKLQQSSDAGDRMPSLATISEAVVLAVREIGSGCSQDMIEQHVKKYCQDASGLQSTDLHSLVTDACKALVSTRRFSSRDGLFYMKSSDELALSRASSTSLLAADRQLPSTTFTDPQVLYPFISSPLLISLNFCLIQNAVWCISWKLHNRCFVFVLMYFVYTVYTCLPSLFMACHILYGRP